MEDYVTFKQAKKLKELGFDEQCFAYYLYDDKLEIGRQLQKYNSEWHLINLGYIAVPTLAQAQKWLFERHEYFISIQYNSEKETFQCIIYKKTFTQGYYCTNESYAKEYFQGCEDIISYDPTYCLSKGITKVLELLK